MLGIINGNFFCFAVCYLLTQEKKKFYDLFLFYVFNFPPHGIQISETHSQLFLFVCVWYIFCKNVCKHLYFSILCYFFVVLLVDLKD